MAVPDDVEPDRLRGKNRRFGLLLLAVVLALALLTVGYVRFYGSVLRDPDAPPSVKALNPRVLTFEVALWTAVVLSLGVTLHHFFRKRR